MQTVQERIDSVAPLKLFEEKIDFAGMNHIVYENFAYYYNQFLNGHTGYLPEIDIQPVSELPVLDKLAEKNEKIGRENLAKTIVIKLNGGLGTGMGLDQAKSLLPIKNGFSFLDIIIEQIRSQQAKLVLMNSFATHQESIEVIDKKLHQTPDVPTDFLQNQIPKINADTLLPAEYPDDPDQEWCPPGHGDIYIALYSSGVLHKLLSRGYKYAFISNADNLGAVLHADLLGYFINQNFDFMMEVAQRTAADKKGGHLAMQNGSFILRESAQCPLKDRNAFENIRKHCFFNTNNLWINLESLEELVEKRNHLMKLPLIVNHKTVNPRDMSSQDVIQLETAMGSAISSFNRSGAILVDRSRFIPVKDTNQLLKVRSDLYELTDGFELLATKENNDDIHIHLHKKYFKNVHDFDARFGKHIPSLKKCESLDIRGNVYFDNAVEMQGRVKIVNSTAAPIHIPDKVMSGEYIF